MSLFRLFKPRGTAPVARERLQILLSHERAAVGPRDLVAILRDELLATIKRHVEIDPEKLSVKMDRSAGYSTLEIDVEIPCEKIDVAAARAPPPPRRPRRKVGRTKKAIVAGATSAGRHAIGRGADAQACGSRAGLRTPG